jgi:polyhydroxybutyrate depolymerase
MRTWIAVLAISTACGTDPAPPSDELPTVFGGDRPVDLQIPLITEGETYPLVLVLHGYGAGGFVQQAYFGLDDLPEKGSFVLAPEGTPDSGGSQFWNADDFCCDFENKNPDDVAYLGGMLDEVMAAWPIDPARVRVIGHSNGGFMSYRLACDRADVVTSIVSLAGNAVNVPCAPARSVHVLHLHGTDDETVPFTGATPSADEWAMRNGCATTRTPGATTLDLDGEAAGAETSIGISDGCPADGGVELWTMTESSHVPTLRAAFDEAIHTWWNDHPRP